MRQRIMIGRLLAAAVLAGGVAMATDTAAEAASGTAAHAAFDTARWTAAAGNPEGSDPRFDMIEAAIAALPPGATRAEVRTLLGAPDKDYGSQWVYYAGTTLFGGEYVLLVVAFEGDAVTTVSRAASESFVAPGVAAQG